MVEFVGLAAMAIWLAVFLAFRISSLSALIAAAVSPAVALLVGEARTSVVVFLMALIVIFAHRANIKRLRAGEEPRFGGSS